MKKEAKNAMSLEDFEKELEKKLEEMVNGECMVYAIICFLEENIKIAKYGISELSTRYTAISVNVGSVEPILIDLVVELADLEKR